MLVLLSGVTAVGKTTVIDHLVSKYGWKQVVTYVTRPKRRGEKDKISLCLKRFTEKEVNGDFFCVDEFFGNYYAVLKSEIEAALNDKEFWVIDRPIEKIDTYKGIDYISIVFLPENEKQLIKQILKCGRTARLNETINNFRQKYSQFYKDNLTEDNRLIVINKINEQSKTAFMIKEFSIEYVYSKLNA
jgi:guanylate kinase